MCHFTRLKHDNNICIIWLIYHWGILDNSDHIMATDDWLCYTYTENIQLTVQFSNINLVIRATKEIIVQWEFSFLVLRADKKYMHCIKQRPVTKPMRQKIPPHS